MSFNHLSVESVAENIKAAAQSQGRNKKCEETLMIFREDPHYLVCLLDLINSTQDLSTQLVAAIEFKNTVYLNWVEDCLLRKTKRWQAMTPLTGRP